MSLFQILGWAGNAAFFSRFLVQWAASERARRTVAPASFWWLSLFGTATLCAYTVHLGEPVLVAGYLVNGLIYARNLWLAHARQDYRIPDVALLGGAVAATGLLFGTELIEPRADWTQAPLWFACVLLGQGLWSSRFVVQWLASERARRSHFPTSFWWLSLAGNVLILAYALHLSNAVLVAGYALGPIVQARNLVIAYRAQRASATLEAW